MPAQKAAIEALPRALYTFSRFLRRIPARFLSDLRQRVEPQVLRHPFLAGLYYGLVCRAFSREQSAVMAGKARYRRDHEQLHGAPTSALLRRNVHRIEKGLTMRPRRPVFAADFIAETVAAFHDSVAHNGSNSEIQWAQAVLSEYFRVVGWHPTVDQARAEFASLGLARPVSNRPLIPYQRDLGEPAAVSYDALLALANRRRSVRWFRQEPVSRDLIDKALEVAAQAPSACNRQPFMFRVFDEPSQVRKVAAIPMGTPGYANNIPVIIVLVGQQRHFFDERDRHLIYVDGSLAAMSFAFALETLGLSSCLINWPDIELPERQMAALIGLEPDERPIMLIAVGYPDPSGLVAASVKKPIELIRRYN